MKKVGAFLLISRLVKNPEMPLVEKVLSAYI